jgi:Ca2+-binding RTX toxin-like protein/subtilisin family serine protease
VAINQSILGDFEGASYSPNAFGDVDESSNGQSVALEAFFYPDNFDISGSEPIAELLFTDPAGGAAANASSATVNAVTFDERSIEATFQQGSPSAFEEGAFTAESNGTLEITVAPVEKTQTGKYQVRVIDLGTSTADDHSDLVSDFTGDVLAINESGSGKINENGDKDLFAVNLTTDNIYDFSVKSYFDGLGTLGKAALRLINSDGHLVSSGKYDVTTGRTELSVSVFENGQYFVEVSAIDLPGNTGTYVLDTRDRGAVENTNDDYASDAGTAITVGPGEPITGEIEIAGDSDWAAVSLEAGKVYVFDVLADGDGTGGTLTDSTLRLLDSEGNELTFDDDRGAGLDSHIQYTAGASGRYFLDVGSNRDSVGTYTLRVRELYSGIADPLRAAQWYLDATHIDELNNQFTGAGVTVAIVDDGIDSSHPDLAENYSFRYSLDTQFDTQDGRPKYPKLIGPSDDHGTAVAGIIGAVANNETGIQGAASNAELVSTRVKWSWADMTQALNDQFNFDVSNNSWGAIEPFSDNFNNTNLTFAWLGLRNGVENGRDGKGTVFVFSAGNQAGLGDNTNYHNFQNAREVIAVGALAQDNTAAGFSTPGANVLVATYGVDMLTTDRHQPGWGYNKATLGDYTTFGGTSAAAPLLSGIVAMMLEANPNLGYRDVQKILAYSSSHPDVQDWKVNGASDFNLGGLLFNDKSGFGAVDAYAAVQLAKNWTTQNTAINEVSASARKFGMNEAIPDGNGEVYTKTFEIDSSMSIEHAELGVDIRHERLGDLTIKLISPNGTVSTLLDRPTVNAERPFGLSGQDSGVPTHLLWDFSSVQYWGEDASGTWTIQIEDVRAEEKGTLQSLSLRIYGENNRGNDIYVFTDEGFQHQVGKVLEDETGTDTVNAAPVRYDLYVDLNDGVIAANATGHSIADWTTIENAVTGAGDDRLVGNVADNILVGNSGDDQFEGGLGNDVIQGGSGADIAVYADIKAHYTLAWDPTTETLTVTDVYSTDGDEGRDTLTGIERLIFADAEMSLGETVGNRAPVANTTFFDSPVLISKGMGVDFEIPDDAFSDADGDSNAELVLSISDPAGGELPEWLAFDEETGQFTGVPPEDYQGQLKLLVTATDEFGESVSDDLTLQFGDNQAPVIDAVKEVSLNEDGELAALSLSLPYDPEGTEVTITVNELPSFGVILDKTGNALAVGSTLTADELTELYFNTAADRYGDAGFFRYTASDEDSVSVRSGVHVFVEPVNDAPRFATASSQLTVNYPEQTTSALDIAKPTDPESTISVVTLIGLPEMGKVLLDGNKVTVNDILTFDQLDRLQYSLNENVNGPVGTVTIQAVDEEGVATNWALNIVVQNADGQAVGTGGEDEIYGSVAIDILYGKGGDDYLVGNAGEDRLYGGLGNDTLIGGSDNDKIDGSAGDDYLDGGSGNDLLAGGPGNDTYIVDTANDLVKEIIGGGAGGDDLVVTSVSFTAPDNVESLTAADDVAIDLTGNALDNVLLGNSANNELLGDEGRDVLLGLGGDDLLNGGLGVDRLVGGDGDDTYYIDSRSDRILELVNQGVDTVYASSSYTLYSNIENLILLDDGDFSAGGNSLDNRLVGNNGNNVLAGGLGADTLEGGLGDDIYVLSDDKDTIIDTGGIDTIRSVLDIDLVAGIENAELVGILNTNANGTAADNMLTGNLGNNTLDGKGGVDILTGGIGADSFVLSYNGDGEDADIITDFASGEDLLIIDLGSFDVDVEALGLAGSGLASEASFVARAGAQPLDLDDHFIFDTAQGPFEI